MRSIIDFEQPDEDELPDVDAPEEVPNWYLFEQLRATQRKIGAMWALLGGLYIVSVVPLDARLRAAVVVGGALAYVIGLLKSNRSGHGRIGRLREQLGLGAVDAEAVIAEREADDSVRE